MPYAASAPPDSQRDTLRIHFIKVGGLECLYEQLERAHEKTTTLLKKKTRVLKTTTATEATE